MGRLDAILPACIFNLNHNFEMALINSTVNLKESILSSIRELKTPSLILYVLALNLIVVFIFSAIRNDFSYIIHANFLPFDSFYEELLIVLLIAPLVETVLYQYAIIDITLFLSKLIFKKELIVLSIILSAICYSLSHLYDYVYMIQMVIAGLLFSIFYNVIKQRNKNAFLYSLLVHLICNLLVFGLIHI